MVNIDKNEKILEYSVIVVFKMEKLRGVGEREGSGGYTEFVENASIRIGSLGTPSVVRGHN